MSKMNAILSERLKSSEEHPKMAVLAKKSASGSLTSFTGIFGSSELSEGEMHELKLLLERYSLESHDLSSDLKSLTNITVEVKAINNQAALLHGERIKRAKELLKTYKEGAFSSWLMNIYGNRQTPYNFLQYYEFYISVSKELHPLIDTLPRQAVYTLASRDAPLDKKEKVLKSFINKTKHEILMLIRELFPIHTEDKRGSSAYEKLLATFEKIHPILKDAKLTKNQKKHLETILDSFYAILGKEKDAT
ncbi:MAG: CT583 family protein [Chlamydiales bacterium]|nr:CT583 family protein [Chlamydiales bacterium]